MVTFVTQHSARPGPGSVPPCFLSDAVNQCSHSGAHMAVHTQVSIDSSSFDSCVVGRQTGSCCKRSVGLGQLRIELSGRLGNVGHLLNCLVPADANQPTVGREQQLGSREVPESLASPFFDELDGLHFLVDTADAKDNALASLAEWDKNLLEIELTFSILDRHGIEVRGAKLVDNVLVEPAVGLLGAGWVAAADVHRLEAVQVLQEDIQHLDTPLADLIGITNEDGPAHEQKTNEHIRRSVVERTE